MQRMVRISASTASVEENFLRNTSSFCYTDRTYEARMSPTKYMNMRPLFPPWDQVQRELESRVCIASECVSLEVDRVSSGMGKLFPKTLYRFHQSVLCPYRHLHNAEGDFYFGVADDIVFSEFLHAERVEGEVEPSAKSGDAVH